MKAKHYTIVAAIVAMFIAVSARSQIIVVSDNYTATTAGTGFGLGAGVNTGINPPTTRITGTAAANLRYLQTATTRSASKYDINSNRLRVVTETNIGRFTLSADGAAPFDFGPSLGSAYATPANKAVYDIKISMRNDATSTARFSFGIATAEGDVTTWDFGIQMYRTTATIDFYTIQKRIDSASFGGTDVNAVLTTTGPNTTNSMQAFVIRVTDAGAETSAYSSKIQVSKDGGATWFYDTDLDPDVQNHFRFDGPGRVIIFDQASNNSGNVFYDNFSITSISSPAPPSSVVWNGAGANDNWSTPENWIGGVAPVNGQPILFDGTTRQANINDLNGFDTLSVGFNVGGFSLSGNPFSVSGAISNLAGVNTIGTDLSFTTTGVKTWSIASGSELVLNNTTTVETNGDHSIVGGGTLHSRGAINIGQIGTANPAFSVFEGKHLIDATTMTTRGGYRIGSLPSGAGAQTVLTNGASLTITATSGNLRVGDSANPNGARLDMDNSTLTLNGSAVFAVGYATGANATVNQNGGVVNVPITSFSESGAGTGSYTIHNGNLTTRVIRKNNSSGSGSIYFDNATISPVSGASNSFMFGLNVAQIQSGGLVLDAGQGDVTVPQALSGSGALIKSNSSAVTLTGTNTYTGNTIILGGKLALPTIQTNATAVQVGNGTEFGVSERALGTTLSVSSLSFAPGNFSESNGAFDEGSKPVGRRADYCDYRKRFAINPRTICSYRLRRIDQWRVPIHIERITVGGYRDARQ
jgi:autotransporter-associated beta strand protein